MGTTFLKRQKEMKRLEKQREKAERRAQKKLANKTGIDGTAEIDTAAETELAEVETAADAGSEPRI